MDLVLESDNPYNGKIVRCGGGMSANGYACQGCGIAKSGYYGPYNPDKYTGNSPSGLNCSNPQTILIYPYKDSMKIINKNFQHTVQLNTAVANQINELNVKITTLNVNINTMQQLIVQKANEVKTLDQNIIINTNKLTEVESTLKKLMDKVAILISFVPQFVRQTSNWFVKLLVGVKTDSLEDLAPMECDVLAIQNMEAGL